VARHAAHRARLPGSRRPARTPRAGWRAGRAALARRALSAGKRHIGARGGGGKARCSRTRRQVACGARELQGATASVERLERARTCRAEVVRCRRAARTRGGTMKADHLSRSRALWNRSRLELESDETLAQLMDRGEIEAWRELFALARTDPG